MNHKTESTNPFPINGGISLLMSLIILAMAVFALLSLSTARSAQAVSQHIGESAISYNQANTQANAILESLRRHEIPDCVSVDDSDGRPVYTYSCAMSDGQELQVEIVHTETSLCIVKWETVSTTPWVMDDDLDVWDGN